MSFYSTMQGEIKYEDRASFEGVLIRLRQGGWVEGDSFVDETGSKMTDGSTQIDPEALTIRIPLFCHRNLSRVDFFPEGAKGYLVGASSDGCFTGWVIEDGQEQTYDLDEWASENEMRPKPDEDEDWDAANDWRDDVIQEFFGAMCP